jgi:hypothetical protein
MPAMCRPPRPEARGIDDVLADDFALVGDHQPAAIGPGRQSITLMKRWIPRPLARGDGIRLRHAIRIDVSAILAV